MAKVTVNTVPDSREVEDITLKFEKIGEERNKAIAKYFNMEPMDIEIRLYQSKGALLGALGPNLDGMGIYAGYDDSSNYVMIVHPQATEGLFSDQEKENWINVDYCLVKYYLCKKYYSTPQDFRLYYKYVSEVLAQVTSGKFKPSVAKFDIKIFSDEKKFRKDQELGMVFHIMFEKSGIDFIYEHLDEIMKDCDIRKTVFTIYKKSFNELITQVQREVLDEEKKLKQVKGK